MKATTRRKALQIKAASTVLFCSLAAFSTAQSGYRIGEDTASADAGPVRMARFDYLKGAVEWRATSTMEWSSASRNLPIRQGSQIYAPDGTRGEVQFDDGSDMRLATGAVATLVTLYSDSKGEFTEIKLNNGLATFHLTNKNSLYQIDTPTGSIKSYGPAEIRVGDTSGCEICLRQGEAAFDCASGSVTLQKNQYLNMTSTQAQPVVQAAPAPDQWDNFNETRDQEVYQAPQYVPSNIGIVAGDINSSGSWQTDGNYGHVWCPREPASWRPYADGHWVYNDPYGWTWVGNEDWGWAPYHYGTWVHASYGWGWVPGPAVQCWSPAVVSFSYYGGNVGWCPLYPGDVHYGVSLGFDVSGLFLGFSIGRAGCYYPTAGGYCEPRPWNNVYVNRFNAGYNVTTINNYYGRSGLGSAWRTTGFVPRNVRYGGGSYVAANSFGRGGSFHALDPHQGQTYFKNGKSFGMPGRGAGQISGPYNVHPTVASFTPSHSFSGHGPSAAVLNRPVYRSAVPKLVARQSTGIGKTFTPSSHAINARNVAARAGAAGVAAAAAHGAANHFAGNSAERAKAARTSRSAGAAAAAAARRSVATHPGGSFTNNHGVTRPLATSRAGVHTSPAAHRAETAHTARPAATHTGGSFARHNATAPARRAAPARTASHTAARPANRSSARASHPAAHTSVRPARRASAPAVHRSAPARPTRSFSAPRSAPRVSRPVQHFSAPRPAQHFSAPRPAQHFSAPRPAPHFSAPAPHFSAPRQSAPRGGGGSHGGGDHHGH